MVSPLQLSESHAAVRHALAAAYSHASRSSAPPFLCLTWRHMQHQCVADVQRSAWCPPAPNS